MPWYGWQKSILFWFCVSCAVWSGCLDFSTSLEYTCSSGTSFRLWFGEFSASSVWLWALCFHWYRGCLSCVLWPTSQSWFRLALFSPPSPASSCWSLVFRLIFAYDNTSIKMWRQMCQQGRRWESVGWWAGTVCPTSLPSFTSKMIIIPGVDPSWLMSHNWKPWKPLFCVSSLYVLTRTITRTTSCREEEYFLWKSIHAASLVDKPDVTQTFSSSLFKGKAGCTHMTNCLIRLLRSDYFMLYLTYANEWDDNGLCFISACHSFC